MTGDNALDSPLHTDHQIARDQGPLLSFHEFSDRRRFKVAMATTAEEKSAIYRLRYQVYIEEMDGGRRHDEADFRNRQLFDQWDERAYHFYVHRGNLVVACARVMLRRDGPMECEEQLDVEKFAPAFPDRVCLTSRLALHPRIRGSHVLKQLTCAIYQFLCEQNIQFSFLDCHTRLLPLYSRLGFRTYRPGFNHEKYTYVIPMVLVVDDVEYLEQVRSPFAAIGRRFPHSTSGRELLFSKFPDAAAHVVSERATNAASIVDLLARLLTPGETGKRCDLLDGLTLEDARFLASLGHIVSCDAGSAVLREGDPGREIFLILDGRFEVRGQIRTSSRGEVGIRKTLGVGDIFGEIRFLTEEIRYASVVAVEVATVLILNAKAMDRLVITAPKIAAKVFRNIARIVATRLSSIAGVAPARVRSTE